MKPSFYSGTSGLIAHQENLNNIGHNMANVSTIGYKNRTLVFDDLLYTQMYVNTPSNPLNGNGVRAVDTGMNFTQGPMRQTDIDLDFAILGGALFAVESNGQRTYSRDGEFSLKLEGADAYVVQSDGSYVLDWTGQRIALGKKEGSTDFDFDSLLYRVGLFRFNNPNALQPAAGNRYLPTVESGQAQLATGDSGKIMKGYLENSTVVMADEMTNMIAAQRAYQVSARVVQVSDELEQTINSLRK